MSGKKKRPQVAALSKLLRAPDVRAELTDLDTIERFEFLSLVADAFRSPIAERNWRPKERWREKIPNETARAFLERVYLSVPYDQRPYTHELCDTETGDRPLYAAVTMLIANNRRLARVGPKGSVNAAKRLDDLFPMIGSGAGAKQRDLPDAFEALLYVAERRANAARRAVEMRGLERAKKDIKKKAPSRGTRTK